MLIIRVPMKWRKVEVDLLENEEFNKKRAKSKKLMIIIIALIVLLLIVSMVLLYMIYEVQRTTLKVSLDRANVNNFASDMFVFEDDKLYVDIKAYAELLGYETYNGDYKSGKYSEDRNNCYITSQNEIASFTLNSNTIYKKVTSNEDYEYFDLEEPVKLINDKLYIIQKGIEIGTNSKIQYDASNNRISILSLDYIVDTYANNFQNAVVVDANTDFNNKKALLYNLVVVTNTDGHYGVYNSSGQEIIGTKYTSITFKEDSQEFTVRTDEEKMGILTSDGATKIEPNYTDIKQISRELNYYLVNNNNKYGVINQNGNIVIYLEYDKIGIDESNFNPNGINNAYILFEKCIPVRQNNKWGILDINGNVILPIEYDNIGCIGGGQSNSNSNNVLVIPQYEAIVVGKEDKYGIINTNGEEYVPRMLDTVYSITSSGEDKYYMSFTWPEENGQQVTYDVDQYFEEHVVQTPETPEIDQNLIANETTTQNTVDANTQTIPENTADSNTQTEDTSSNVAQQ